MPAADQEALAALITQMGPLPPVSDLPAKEIVDATGHDKKIVAGQLHFVLPTGIGSTRTVTDVTGKELTAAVRDLGLRA